MIWTLRENLSRPSDACEEPVNGGYKHCPKCKIHFCWYCRYVLQKLSKEYTARYPMCGGKFI